MGLLDDAIRGVEIVFVPGIKVGEERTHEVKGTRGQGPRGTGRKGSPPPDLIQHGEGEFDSRGGRTAPVTGGGRGRGRPTTGSGRGRGRGRNTGSSQRAGRPAQTSGGLMDTVKDFGSEIQKGLPDISKGVDIAEQEAKKAIEKSEKAFTDASDKFAAGASTVVDTVENVAEAVADDIGKIAGGITTSFELLPLIMVGGAAFFIWEATR